MQREVSALTHRIYFQMSSEGEPPHDGEKAREDQEDEGAEVKTAYTSREREVRQGAEN